MSSLRPIGLESCQTGLRHRCSINSLTVAPQYLSQSTPMSEDCSVFDETDQHEITTGTTVELPTEFVTPVLSPVTDAHMSDYASKVTIPRHHNTLNIIATCDPSSPTSISPLTTLTTIKPSFMTLVGERKPEQVRLERLRWRLASGFFAYFLCGWGDGGKWSKHFFCRTCSYLYLI